MRCRGIYRTAQAISVAGEGREGGRGKGRMAAARKGEQRGQCKADQSEVSRSGQVGSQVEYNNGDGSRQKAGE
jgi:hypothetical protein